MSDIQVGSHVTWQERNRVRPYLHTLTGKVTNVGEEYIEVVTGGFVDILPRTWLTVVPSAIEVVADADYHLLVGLAGDLSGAELG